MAQRIGRVLPKLTHAQMTPSKPLPVIAIHGGAGTMSRSNISAEQNAAYHAALQGILQATQQLLADGGSALDAVSLAVDLFEDCPLFNAGHGAVFTHDETHELDAAVMDGATLRAGAVACVSRVRHPVRAARAVMEHTEHVLPALGGRGGLIAIDAQGNLSLPFNTEGMYRGWARVGEAPQTAIFR